MTQDKRLKVLICSDRAGYGHIRGMLGIADMLSQQYADKVVVETGIFSDLSTPMYREKWRIIDDGLGFVYKYLTDLSVNQDPVDLLNYIETIWNLLSNLDAGAFENYVKQNEFDLTIGAHPIIGALLHTEPGILVGLDPYAELYFSANKNIITTAVNRETLVNLNKLGAYDVRETGAMIPYNLVKAREQAKHRIDEIRSGKPIKVSILTGGSLTHGEQITQLTGAFAELTTIDQVEKIYVVVGNSKIMLDSVTKATKSDPRFEIVFDENQIELVRKADTTLVQADLVIAKTGELPQCVIPAGKAFKTFHIKPSMGPQELQLRKYPEELSRVNGLSALEEGIEPRSEVRRILVQKQDGTLAQMMENGLRVPADGTKNLANIVMQFRDDLLYY